MEFICSIIWNCICNSIFCICIDHFVVVYHADKKHVWVSDPIKGHVKYTIQEFRAGWYPKNENKGVLLALEPTSDFKLSKQEKDHNHRDWYIDPMEWITVFWTVELYPVGRSLVQNIVKKYAAVLVGRSLATFGIVHLPTPSTNNGGIFLYKILYRYNSKLTRFSRTCSYNSRQRAGEIFAFVPTAMKFL